MWILTIFLIFSLSLEVAMAQQKPLLDEPSGKAVNQQLNQKIKMAEHILNGASLSSRLAASNDDVAKQLVARAKDNFRKIESYMNSKQFLAASAIIDYVLRDLSASSQLLNISNKKRKNYQNTFEKLDSFVLPQWKKLSDVDHQLLNKTLTEIEEFKNDAILKYKTEDYDEAIKLLETAYYLKMTLIGKLQHESTVVYDLKFDSDQDEYQYMVDRTYHFLDLVDLVISKKQLDIQTRKLVDNYIYRSLVNLEAAESYKSEEKYSDAITVLGKSINQLSTVLKLLGIKI